MDENFYSLIGGLLVFAGVLFFLIPVSARILLTGSLYIPSPIPFLVGLGFILAGLGLKFGLGLKVRLTQVFLTKEDEPIHSARGWSKGIERDLYLTSCGRVVSINQDSKGTAHVGYGIVAAKRANCRNCCLKEGRKIMDSAFRKEY
ncbi:MAG: hypothetical protein ACFFEF_10330 [Candidatus Thorarchaeota archaeon]